MSEEEKVKSRIKKVAKEASDFLLEDGLEAALVFAKGEKASMVLLGGEMEEVIGMMSSAFSKSDELFQAVYIAVKYYKAKKEGTSMDEAAKEVAREMIKNSLKEILGDEG